MARKLNAAELAVREVAKLRDALQQVRGDKSFVCLKERTQEAVKAVLGEQTPAGVRASDGSQP